MPSKAEGVGALDYPDDDRRGLARKSHGFRCPRCGARPVQQLPPRLPADARSASNPQLTEAKSAKSADDTTVNGVVPHTDPPAPPSPDLPEDPRTSVTELSTREDKSSHPQPSVVELPDEVVVESTSTTEEPSAAADESNLSSQTVPVSSHTVPQPPEPRVLLPEPDDIDEITPLHPPPTEPTPTSSRHQLSQSAPLTDTGVSERSRSRMPPPATQEKELLYIAYAIVVLMIAVIARRVVKIVTE